MLDPNPRRGAAEQIEILGKQAPDFAGVLFGLTTIGTWYPHCLKWNALRMQHTKHIVIRSYEQLCRILKGLIFGEPLWVRMAMWANNRQVAHFIIKRAGSVSEHRVGWKKSLIVK